MKHDACRSLTPAPESRPTIPVPGVEALARATYEREQAESGGATDLGVLMALAIFGPPESWESNK